MMRLPPKELLGTKSDRQLAKDYNISQATVFRLRAQYGIPPYCKVKDIPKECLDSLGKIPDSTLSKTYNISEYYLKKARKELGIGEAKRSYKRKVTLTKDQVALLGTMSDQQVADKLGLIKSMVTRRRRELGIPPFVKCTRWNPTLNWTPELDSLLGTMPDPQLAKQLNVRLHVVYKRRTKLQIPGYKISYDPELLFTHSTKELMALWGVSDSFIYKLRKKHAPS
jgi:hypothetical protein